ncbi:hypothetical protein [Sorangium sp. So ce1153]|uniref:hypothetical protein n=1 Tax=Sorangium sp. So ce1153 TaxID=3133333 RepID=UPI003F5E33B3
MRMYRLTLKKFPDDKKQRSVLMESPQKVYVWFPNSDEFYTQPQVEATYWAWEGERVLRVESKNDLVFEMEYADKIYVVFKDCDKFEVEKIQAA